MPNPVTANRSKLSAIQNETERTAPVRIPSLPKSLPKEYRTEWRALVQHLIGQDAWIPQKASLVEAYLVNVAALREAQTRLAADGMFTPDGKPHPASAIIARHSGYMTKLAGQLGLGLENLKPNKPAKPDKPDKRTWSA